MLIKEEISLQKQVRHTENNIIFNKQPIITEELNIAKT